MTHAAFVSSETQPACPSPQGLPDSDLGLAYGPYACGFRLECRRDTSRHYGEPSRNDTPGHALRPLKSFRPILLATWFPAEASADGQPLCQHEYLDPTSAGPEFEPFLTPLFAFNREMACRNALGQPTAALTPEEREAVEDWWDGPTKAVRNATTAPGRHPLVVYHPGLASSFQDHAALWECLATHGYIIISSAFPPEDAGRLGIDGDFDRSARDFQFILNAALAEANVDAEKVAVMGHSFGAHTASALRALPGSPIDAVVSLDSTMEYQPPDAEDFAHVRARLGRPERMTAPMLLISGMKPFWTFRVGADGKEEDGKMVFHPPCFEFYDGLPYATRLYTQVRHLKHGEFVSSGAALGALRRSLSGDAVGAALVRETHRSLCVMVRRFLDAFLRGDAAAEAELRDAANDKGEANAVVIQIATAAPAPPQPCHLVTIMEAAVSPSEGLATVEALCARSPGATLLDDLRRAGRGLRERGRAHDGVVLLEWAAKRYPESAAVCSDIGDALDEDRHPTEAVFWYRQALNRIDADASLAPQARDRAGRYARAMLRRHEP